MVALFEHRNSENPDAQKANADTFNLPSYFARLDVRLQADSPVHFLERLLSNDDALVDVRRQRIVRLKECDGQTRCDK